MAASHTKSLLIALAFATIACAGHETAARRSAEAPAAKDGPHGGDTAPEMDHAAMGHDAPPGPPAATLQADEIDAPAETSLREAERAAALAKEMAGGHGMHHGAPYRQLDAGRDDKPSSAPSPAPTPTPKPSPHRHH